MPNYKYENNRTSPNFTAVKRTVKGITIHHWGIDGQSFNGVVNFLCTHWMNRKPQTKTSAHYVVEDGRVSCIVDPDYIAWHAGSLSANRENIGIECRPEMTDGDLEAVAQLIAELRKTYGMVPLNMHKDHKSTACPGRYVNRMGWLDKRSREILSGNGTTTKDTEGKPWPHGIVPVTGKHTAASHAAYVAMLAGVGFKDDSLTRAIQKWLRWNGYYGQGYIIDGIMGPMTVRELQKFLKSKKFYSGVIDGKRGPMTVKAEIAYINSQRKHY